MTQQKRHRGPATFASKVRGLMLGLAVGDAVGSGAGEVDPEATLPAGVATQLAAWTAEGLLRTATRYGGNVINNPIETTGNAYQRWAMLRGGAPADGGKWADGIEVDRLPTRGWLMDVPAMAAVRGSSPTTLKAVTTGCPQPSPGCQATLRALPVAAFVGQEGVGPLRVEQLSDHARALAALTHSHPDASTATGLAVRIAAHCLVEDQPLNDVVSVALDSHDEPIPEQIAESHRLVQTAPGVASVLGQVAPDKSGLSALAGGIYAALSFPAEDQVREAILFARNAPDPDSVAAITGTLLGALHGREALPSDLVERLELGWVVDRLASDLALQVSQNQAGHGWKSGWGPDDILDPWWDTKYPGV